MTVAGDMSLPEDPHDALVLWLKAAEAAGLPEPTAATLATATPDGRPSARVVLFKGFSVASDQRKGLSFYTHYASPKSQAMDANPAAAMVFFWAPLKRQVRIEGLVEKLGYQESNSYFQTRPRGSQIGAWASPQSQPIESREALLKRFSAAEAKFVDSVIPCPQDWGGWRLIPQCFEFWEGADHRLHDRCLFTRRLTAEGGEPRPLVWEQTRLAP